MQPGHFLAIKSNSYIATDEMNCTKENFIKEEERRKIKSLKYLFLKVLDSVRPSQFTAYSFYLYIYCTYIISKMFKKRIKL